MHIAIVVAVPDRRAEFLQQPWIQALRWMRMIGDVTFLVGVGAFGWFMAGLWFGWSYEVESAAVAAPLPLAEGVTV